MFHAVVVAVLFTKLYSLPFKAVLEPYYIIHETMLVTKLHLFCNDASYNYYVFSKNDVIYSIISSCYDVRYNTT